MPELTYRQIREANWMRNRSQHTEVRRSEQDCDKRKQFLDELKRRREERARQGLK